MDAREAIFSNFSRNVGSPIQYTVHNREQFNRFIATTSGLNDQCYASTCSYHNKIAVFEDLFLEMDSLELFPIIEVGNWYTAHKIPWIPLFSGNRGIHIHALFSPEIVSKQTIEKFANLVIEETHTEGKFDSHVTGDLRRLARIPNTKRLNELWCIPLTREDILRNISPTEIMEKAKTPQNIQYKIPRRPYITEFVKNIIPQNIETHYNIPVHGKTILKDALRPCIWYKINQPNPRDNTRITATVEALSKGISIEKLLDFYQSLNWIDFDREYTRYQITNINERVIAGTIRPLGKSKIDCTKKIPCIKCILTGAYYD